MGITRDLKPKISKQTGCRPNQSNHKKSKLESSSRFPNNQNVFESESAINKSCNVRHNFFTYFESRLRQNTYLKLFVYSVALNDNNYSYFIGINISQYSCSQILVLKNSYN